MLQPHSRPGAEAVALLLQKPVGLRKRAVCFFALPHSHHPGKRKTASVRTHTTIWHFRRFEDHSGRFRRSAPTLPPHITSHNLPYEKVGKNELVCIADEVPFEIPESWEWVRLGELFQHNTGKALNSSNRSGKLLTYITTSNLYWNRFEIDNLREMYFSEAEIQKCTAIKGDFLVCEGGDIGRAAIWSYDTDIRIQNHIHRLRPYYEICVEYYYYIFFLYKHAGWIGGKGIGIQGLSSNALHSLLFPLPPLQEQRRIVIKIKETAPFVDKYEQIEQHLNDLNVKFPEMLKKSILQEAVQGKTCFTRSVR